MEAFQQHPSIDEIYDWSYSGGLYKAFGIINDDSISKIEVVMNDGDNHYQDEFYDNMFLIHWSSYENKTYDIEGIRAYDKDNNIVFEDVRHIR